MIVSPFLSEWRAFYSETSIRLRSQPRSGVPKWIGGRSSRAHAVRAGKLYGYTSAVGAIGQAMGITVRAPRHAHACVDVTEPAPPAPATATATGR